jgi:hypothetical protein
MSTSFSTKPAPYSRELIEKEIDHLKKRRGTRSAADHQRAWSKVIVCAVIFGLLWLWGMDAVLFSYNRGDAINVYVYLHNYGNDAKATALAQSGLLTDDEVKVLNARQGSFQDYFKGPAAASARADQLIGYMHQVSALQQGRYDALSPLNKARYLLFIRTGLIPPTRWNALNSSIDK